MAVLGCSYLGSQNIIVIHQILAKITTIEEERIRKEKEKKEEEKKKADSEKKGEEKKNDLAEDDESSMNLLRQLGLTEGGLSSKPASNKGKSEDISKEGEFE